MPSAAQNLDNLSGPELDELYLLLEDLERIDSEKTSTCVGLVCPHKGLTHAVKKVDGKWVETQDTPDCYLPAITERILTSLKRFIIVIGGRGSAKSVSVGDICLIDVRDKGAKTYCLREYQSSIKNSVHSLLKDEATRLEFDGFEVQQNAIRFRGHEAFEFAGLARNVDSIKSAHGFKRFWMEESQYISAMSLRALTPTARQKPNKGLPGDIGEVIVESGVSMVFVANPASSQDPFSQRFIVPYQDALERDGYYEDDLHLIVVMNYTDNPWFAESGLEAERRWDYDHLPRALYDHIWLGKFNDSVDNALITAEWFDACIDAHKVLGFAPRGVRVAAHDPSDKGADSKGYAMRHGSVVLDIEEKTDGDVNEGGHWAADIAISQKVDFFAWDGDGMGAGLAEQMGKDFHGKKVQLAVFRGSENPDNPDAMYSPAIGISIQDQKSNIDAFRNKRAQYYFSLRDRIYRTYRAVVHKEYHDPDTLISFANDIPLLSKLRSEVCRLPIKPNINGRNELYTKEYMKTKLKIPSPNLADPVMMCMRYQPVKAVEVVIPKPIKTIGRRR